MSTSPIQRDVVSSAGSAWIICQSKSYPGRVYYFNTLTGEAAWNLSEPELQNAKQRTNILEKQAGFLNDNCPEPAYSPQDISSQGYKRAKPVYHKTHTAKVYNKQIINNQFTKPLSVEQISNCNGSNHIQFNVPITPTFNGIWNVPPQPIFVAPTQVHPVQPFINLNQVPGTNTSGSLSSRFQNIRKLKARKKNQTKVFKRNFKPRFNNGQRNNFTKTFHNMTKNDDLRSTLHSTRSSYNNVNENQACNHSASDFRKTKTGNRNTFVGTNIFNRDDDDMWLEGNLQSHGKRDKLNLSLLKKKVQINSSDIWYVVADSNALLNNINFINIFINSDGQCRLLVPKIVMDNIQNAANSRLKTQAHRASYFISQVDAVVAIIDDCIQGTFDEINTIELCCMKMIQEDCHVIVLSDEVELKNLQVEKICVFTISEIKSILLDKSQDENVESFEPRPNVIKSSNIKIIIPNSCESNELYQTHETDELVQDGSEANEINTDCASNIQLNPDTNIEKEQTIRKFDKSSSYEGPEKKKKLFQLNRGRRKSTTNMAGRLANVEKDSTKTYLSTNKSKVLPECNKEVNQNEEHFRNNRITGDVTDIKENETRNGQVLSGSKILNEECDNVMFEVANEAMEEYLRIKSDEWVSRFIQIMEEALSQILQQKPSFRLEAMSPPWTIYEATECIKRKFHFDSDVVNATSKLLNVLFELGGLRGKIKHDISPQKYMEMYSFGVYLIDALQGILNNSEDLQTAAESLSKLLKDIQNPHLDPCNQDSFTDLQVDENNSFNENGTVLSEPEKEMESTHKTDRTPSNTSTKDENISGSCLRQYNLRSHKKNILQDKEGTTFIDPIKSKSPLKKKLDTSKENDSVTIFSKTSKSKDLSCVGGYSESNIKRNNDRKIDEPKITRKFTKFSKYEERIKEKTKPYDFWTYGTNFEEELDYEVTDDEYNGNENVYESDVSDKKTEKDAQNKKNNVDFDGFLRKLETYIKRTYNELNEFCKKSYEKLSSNPNDTDKYDINVLAEKAYVFIENLCNSFTRILEREKTDSVCKIQEVFKNTDEEIVVPEGRIEDYRLLVNHSLLHGNDLRDTVKLILEASTKTS